MFAFVHRFVPSASNMSAPLHEIRKMKNFEKSWTSVQDIAFDKCKKAITKVSTLAHPDPNAQVEIWTDASDFAMGAVLSQKQGRYWMPLSYWSRRFNNSQMNYSPFDKELLALSMAIDHFRDFEGQIHTVRTDHKPLLGALKKSNDKFNAF